MRQRMGQVLVEHPLGTRVEMDDALLDAFSGELDNENEHTTWTGYRCKCHGDIVQRSVHVTVKRSMSLFGETGEIG